MPPQATLPGSAGIAEWNGALRGGSVKARQAVGEAARRLRQEAQAGGPVKDILEDEALRTAHDVEKELGRGRTRGLLQGVPFAVSELVSVAGRVPPWDSQTDPRLSGDAAIIERLRKARSMPLAVVASPELGGLSQGLLALEDGCAWLAARRLLPFAVAVDFNGNVLRAALAQGCCALRPTFGLTSAFGLAPLGWTLATASVLASCAEDCGTALAQMSGGDSRSPHCPGRAFSYAPQYARSPDQLRAAVAAAEGSDALLAALRGLGLTLTAFPSSDLPAGGMLMVMLAAEAGEALALHLPALRNGDAFLADAQSLSAFDYLHAMRLRRRLQQWFAEATSLAEVMVLPTGSGAHHHAESAAGENQPCPLCDFLSTAILAGAPVYVCARAGEPGFVATARPWSENTLLRLSSALEAALRPRGFPDKA